MTGGRGDRQVADPDWQLSILVFLSRWSIPLMRNSRYRWSSWFEILQVSRRWRLGGRKTFFLFSNLHFGRDLASSGWNFWLPIWKVLLLSQYKLEQIVICIIYPWIPVCTRLNAINIHRANKQQQKLSCGTINYVCIPTLTFVQT